MATKIQFRRGTAAQWVDADPVLAVGEAGFETDTQVLRVGNGTDVFTDLIPISTDYAIDTANSYTDSAISSLIGGAPGLLDTLNELAAAINDDATFFTTIDTRLDGIDTTVATKLTATLANGKVWIGNGSSAPIATTLNTDAVPEGSSNLYMTSERVQDTASTMITSGTHSGITTTYNDNNGSNGTLNLSVTNQFTSRTTDNLNEGTTNKYFTNERAQDALALAFEAGTHQNITIEYDDINNHFNFTGVSGLTQEEIQDWVAPLFTHAYHTNVSVTYNDALNRLEIEASGGGGGGGGTSIGNNPPSTPVVGDLWFQNTTGKFYVNDGTYWVEIASLNVA